MELKKIHMGTMSFDTESMDEIHTQLKKAFSNNNQQDDFSFKRHNVISEKIKDFVCALALCHNVSIIIIKGYSYIW